MVGLANELLQQLHEEGLIECELCGHLCCGRKSRKRNRNYSEKMTPKQTRRPGNKNKKMEASDKASAQCTLCAHAPATHKQHVVSMPTI
jgi:hypothetical protein